MADSRERRQSDHIIGEVLASRYRVESLLGEGAMGAVYKATHVKVGRAFAVKVLHPKLLEDDKVAQRFDREAELAGRLRHPNVIGVVDVGETTDGLRYMVMDFAAGPDLAQILDEAPLPGPRIIHLVKQLLEGLYHAHENGLIHRDFKPENVIVEKDTHGAELPKIVDFGIAILREGGDSPSGEGRLTTNGLVLGTPHYMAPEQAVADPIDHRIDLFALGIVIYEMLCGKLPFDGTGAEVARANLLLDPPAISVRVPYLEVDPLLEAFARKLMAKKRDQRPATAKAAREILDLIETNRDAAAHALGLPPASARVPMITAPSAPQPRHAYDGADTFPPPIAAAASEVEEAAPRDPGPQARLQTAPVHRTDAVAPLDQPRRRGLMFAAFGAAVGAAVIAVVLMSGSDKPAPRTAELPVAPPIAVAPEQPPTPVKPPVEDVKPPVAVPDPKPPEVAVVDPVAVKKDPKKQHPVQAKRDPKVIAVTPPGTTNSPGEVKPVPVKSDPTPAKFDANSVTALYRQVGDQLAKAGDGADALRSQYRLIRINDAFKGPEAMDATAKKLLALRSQAAKLPPR